MSDHASDRFKRRISALDLIFVGLGSIIGSGWLFAAGKVASIAGPAGCISWIIGGVALLLLGLVYAELGAAMPEAGGLVRYPAYTHGPIVSYLVSFVTVIAFSSLIAIEVLAVRQYASGWWPALGADAPTLLGWFVQLALFGLFFLLNYWSVGVFAKSNTIITWFKFIVPGLVVVVLLSQLKGANFSVSGFAPGGVSSITSAVATGGVMFAYLGLTPLVALAGEVKNPQRNLPIALIGTTVLSTLIYILLQLAFVGSVPTDMVAADGWAGVGEQFNLPYYDIAIALGFVWLAVLITVDSAVSPGGTGNIYMSTTPRVIYGWARTGTLFRIFGRVDPRTGIPRPALWATLVLSIFWTLPFPSWGALISVVSSALIFSYALAPISAHALRLSEPDMARPFKLKGFGVISPLAFVIASLILYWSGWSTISWMLGAQVVMFVIYLVVAPRLTTSEIPLATQIKSALWLVFYYLAVMLVSALGSFGGLDVIASPWDQIAIAAIALVSYHWAVFAARLPASVAARSATEVAVGVEGASPG